MALEGNLEEFNIVAVLQTIAGGHLSGTLTVWDEVNRTKIAFVQGYIIHAASALEGDRFGEILVRTHRITREQLEKAAASQLRQYSGKRLGQILLEAHLIAPADLDMAIQIQILEIMSRLLLASRGRWHFQFDPHDAGAGVPTQAMTVDEVLSGQVMLLDNLEPLYSQNRMLDEVYTVVPGRNKESDRGALEGDEWVVLSAIDGKSTVRELAARLGMEPDAVCEVIADLLAVQLLTRADPRPGTPGQLLLSNVVQPALPAPQPGPAVSRQPMPAPDPQPARLPPAQAPDPRPARLLPVQAPDHTVVVNVEALDLIRQVLAVLLARSEGKEVCLIDSSGSLIAREGGQIHSTYPMLFALAASIFASWQELGHALGERKTSTLLYQGSGLNICLTPVGSRAILMTLYHHTSNSGLVNFWSREASLRIGRVLARAAGTPAAGSAPSTNGSGPRPAADGRETRSGLSDDFQNAAARQVDDRFRE